LLEYTSTIDLRAAVKLIRETDGSIVVLTHAKPDGDGFGAVVAMTAALKAYRKQVTACVVPPVPVNLMELRGNDLLEIYDGSQQLHNASLYIVLDTGAWSQVGPLCEVIEQNLSRVLIVDHHLSGDIDAAYRLIDGNAAACCEIVAELIELLLQREEDRSVLLPVIYENLFVGIASDTGWFRFSNTRPQTHELAAKLLRHGVDHSSLYRQLEQAERPEKLSLLIHALDSLKMIAGGRAAIMTLRSEDFIETGALEEETERLIDIPQQVDTIRVIVLISEKKQLAEDSDRVVTRLSFRSKPGPNAINVAELAARFGGGGHARAAGATVDAPVDQVIDQVTELLNEAAAFHII